MNIWENRIWGRDMEWDATNYEPYQNQRGELPSKVHCEQGLD